MGLENQSDILQSPACLVILAEKAVDDVDSQRL